MAYRNDDALKPSASASRAASESFHSQARSTRPGSQCRRPGRHKRDAGFRDRGLASPTGRSDQDTVADNASAAAFVLGIKPSITQVDLVLAWCWKEQRIIGTGAGAASMGNPVTAVAWLANTLGGLGLPLKSGEVILSGSLSIMFPIQAGDSLRMRLGGVGSVACRFT
jgi:2-keto-4-pentenoate hydratase